MQPIKCASCGSPDLEFFPGNYGRCRSCGTTFAENAQAAPQQGPMPYQPSYYVPPPPPPPPMGYPQQRSAGAGVVIAIAVIMALLLGAGVAAYALTVRGSSHPAMAVSSPSAPVSSSCGSSPINAEVPVVVETPREPKTSAEYRDVGSAPFSDGKMWIGRYFNTGETVIGSGSITLSLFDASGKRLVEQSGYLSVDWLEPGQFTLVNIWVPKVPEYARQEIKVKCEPVADYVAKPLAVAIVEQSVRKSSTYSSDFVGTVRNTNKASVEFIKIVVYGYDDKGAPSCVAYGYATEKLLAPGEESGFSVSLGGINVGTPVRYVAQAFARAK